MNSMNLCKKQQGYQLDKLSPILKLSHTSYSSLTFVQHKTLSNEMYVSLDLGGVGSARYPSTLQPSE